MSVRTNRATNPSAEVATTGFTAVAGTTGVISAGCVSTTATTAFGTKVSRTTWTTASTAAGGGQYVEIDLATSGLAVADVISAAVFHVLSHIVTRLQFSVEFRTNVATISTTSAATQKVTAIDTVYGDATAPDAAMVLEALVIPATCTKIRIRVLSIAGTSYANWSIGSYLDLDGVQIVKEATIGAYIDGDQGNAYGWTGVEHASTSVINTPEVSIEALVDPSPSPRVEITMTDLYPSTSSVTLYRVLASGATNSVRGAIGLFAQGGFFVTDHEAPLGATVTYRAMQYDEDGVELGYTPSADTILPIYDEDWISDPLRPANALRVEFTDQAGTRPSRPIPNAIKRVYGADGIRFIALVGDQGVLTALNMDFYTSTVAELETMQQIIHDANGLLLIRTPPVGAMKMIPRTLYAVFPDAVPDDFNFSADVEDAEWSNTVHEVSQPEVGLAESLVTWQTYIDAFPLWTDFNAAYLTWLEAIQNPPEV